MTRLGATDRIMPLIEWPIRLWEKVPRGLPKLLALLLIMPVFAVNALIFFLPIFLAFIWDTCNDEW